MATSEQILKVLTAGHLVRRGADGYDVLSAGLAVKSRAVFTADLHAVPVARVRIERGSVYFGTGWRRRTGMNPPKWIEEWDLELRIADDGAAASKAITLHLAGTPPVLIDYLPDAKAIEDQLTAAQQINEGKRLIVVDSAQANRWAMHIASQQLEDAAQLSAAPRPGEPFAQMTIAQARKIVCSETAQRFSAHRPDIVFFPNVLTNVQAQLALEFALRSVPVVVNAGREQVAALVDDPNELARFG